MFHDSPEMQRREQRKASCLCDEEARENARSGPPGLRRLAQTSGRSLLIARLRSPDGIHSMAMMDGSKAAL